MKIESLCMKLQAKSNRETLQDIKRITLAHEYKNTK